MFADQPKHHFLHAGVCIEMPRTVLGYERKRERPVLRADMQNLGTVGCSHEPMHFLIFADKSFAFGLVCDRVFRQNGFLFTPPNSGECVLIVASSGEVQATRALLY